MYHSPFKFNLYLQRLVVLLVILLGVAIFPGCGQRPVSTEPTLTPTSDSEPSIITTGNTGLPVAAPLKLKIQNGTFNVRAVEIQKNQWRYQSGQPNSAQWVYGTLINYVIGLEATPKNTELFQSLTEADSLELTLVNGKILTFQFSGRQWVEQDAAPDVFQQLRPGLTLALLGDKGTQRLVVTSSFVSSIEPTPAPGESLASVGTWVKVGEARVIVLDGRLAKDVAGLLEGYVYYLVDFSVEALGPGTLDASMFQMDLVDGLGKRYAMSIPASQAGVYGPAGGQLEAGQALTATAGYLVPESVSGPTLTWIFAPHSGVQSPARIELALTAPAPTPDPRSSITVQLNTVAYGPDQADIVISGGIGNPTDQVLAVNGEDIVLESGATRMSLISADPALPWSIEPGESRAFTLNFARPAPGMAILHILHWSFELSGLQ